MSRQVGRIGSLVALVAGLGVAVHGVTIPDDHGNTPATATPMPGGSNIVSGVIDYDTDVDVFSFPFRPMRSYAVRVSTGTVWDLKLEVRPPAYAPVVIATNTVWTNAPVSTVWTNPGAAARWYLAVSGMFQFTTGSYQIAVWEANPAEDSDNDGIADAWETQYFGNLNTANQTSSWLGGGTLDLHAYLAGVNPTNGVAIRSWTRSGANLIAGWPVAPYSTYDLYGATNLFGSWEWLGRQTLGGEGGWLSWTNASGDARLRFFQFRFIY
ncbi:MAG TPA: hypothetical protein PKE26_01380 [Kiritimatiellia bacterium]|nr:hypothetical protein [Kiritimatiellia bacterium]HMO97744.1 hypothetical protein [Kiritimatiellia bacterium]HMP95383.1 hypothetical protein [Kiritimatiellia bacterium]